MRFGAVGASGYVVNLVEDPESVGWDGLAETWFESREQAVAGFESEPTRSLLALDRPKFLDEVKIMFVEEHVVVEPPKRNATN